MPRAMLLLERQADASWLPTTVILATPKRLQGKCLPGNADRDARLARILTDSLPPRINDQTEERGTHEGWIDWAINALANGHATWTTEVVPTETVEALYRREVVSDTHATSECYGCSHLSQSGGSPSAPSGHSTGEGSP